MHSYSSNLHRRLGFIMLKEVLNASMKQTVRLTTFTVTYYMQFIELEVLACEKSF